MARSPSSTPLTLTRFLRDLVLIFGGSVLVVAAVTRWVAVPWAVEGLSMSPTLHDGDRVIVALTSYRRHAPRIGDVVLLEGPGGMPLVKRVAEPPVDVRPGTLWVLGDNAAESSDSREFGPLPLNRVRGRVSWRYWPPSRWGAIE